MTLANSITVRSLSRTPRAHGGCDPDTSPARKQPGHFRNRATTQTIRTRHIYGQFDLTAPTSRDAIRDDFIQQTADELMIPVAQIEFVRFDLKHAETAPTT
ncbi:hypothetical protein ACFYQ5_32300 [Streptomyces sp. NPDC005794]|uniref:hypothetical protein n=1 Tax=Streptomyces sp. NPDC005794 TaxID=3364733 RepID=UPI0036BE05A0